MSDNLSETKDEKVARLRRCIDWHRRRADEMEQELKQETSDGARRDTYTKG